MKVMIFDTETTDLNKCFCYNIGYVIADTETQEILTKKEFVVEQIWHNLPLFSTAYYADKRQIYVNSMRAKKVKMEKFGNICQAMIRDIKAFEVTSAYAYNSPFDEKVFNFNCDWFKCINPFDTIPIFDIRGYVHNSLISENYKAFCEENELFTEGGNYSTSAETVYKYITNDIDFIESHTALDDAVIETSILFASVNNNNNLEYSVAYPVQRTIPREVKKTLTIDYKGKQTTFDCYGYTVYRTKNLIKIKQGGCPIFFEKVLTSNAGGRTRRLRLS